MLTILHNYGKIILVRHFIPYNQTQCVCYGEVILQYLLPTVMREKSGVPLCRTRTNSTHNTTAFERSTIIMRNFVLWILIVLSVVIAVMTFGHIGPVGAIVAAFTLVAALATAFFQLSGGIKAKAEKVKAIKKAEADLADARDELADARDDAAAAPGDAALQAALAAARQKVADAKAALAAAKA